MPDLLLLLAIILGTLAFFEPCTIATHTLFSARAYKKKAIGKLSDIAWLWLSRSALLIILFTLSTLFFDSTAMSHKAASIGLVIMALLYLLSRKIYLPVPHLEFYRLLPFSSKFADSIRLGLTLPACTLPLMVIMLVLSASVHSVSFAILAALLFSLFFTLPIVVATWRGISDSGADFLAKAAHGAPYLTAILLVIIATYLSFPSLSLSDYQLKTSFAEASMAGLGLAFLAGLVFSFNPVSFASIPVILAYVTGSKQKQQALSLAGVFIFGLILTHLVLGIIAALGGDWVKTLLGRQWALFLGPILILLGLMWAGWLRIKLPWFSMRGKRVSGHWGAFLLSIPFSVAICPFCAPALLIALTASASIGSVWFGAILLLSFAIGRCIPILLGAWSISWLESLQIIGKYHRAIELLAGITMILSGLYLLNEYFYLFPSLTLMS